MTHHRRREFLSASLALSLPGWATTAGAQSPAAWPQKTIKILVPNPAGGSADLFPRLVSEALSSKLGQTIVIENKPGAAGNIAAEMLFNAEPDGYTLMAAPPPPLSINVSLYPKLNYDPAKFVPITVFSLVPNALMVHPSVPANSVQELIAYAKANPDKFTYGSTGNGTSPHIAGEMLKSQAGIFTLHIPYRGSGAALQDLLGGNVDYLLDPGIAFSHVRSGRLRLLAVTSPQRLSMFPDAPTLNELGLKNFDAGTSHGFWAPAGTPAAIVDRLNREINRALMLPSAVESIKGIGAEPTPMTPAEFGAVTKADARRFAQIIKERKIVHD